MDLERLGQSAAAGEFVRAYVAESRDLTLYRLLDFYRCYRAFVRGKVCGFRAENSERALRRSIGAKATSFFQLADRYAKRLARPKLIVMTGLIGVGKSSVARALAGALDLQYFSSDRLRKDRAGLDPKSPQYVSYGTGIYSAQANR